MNEALAYFNWGRWVVDCPQPGCSDAREVKPPQLEDVCVNGHPFRIVMPPVEEAAAIAAELRKRVRDADQSWYPRGHVRAELAGQPTGQTLAQLRDETGMVEAERARQQAERDQLVATLAKNGISISPDGRFEGRV